MNRFYPRGISQAAIVVGIIILVLLVGGAYAWSQNFWQVSSSLTNETMTDNDAADVTGGDEAMEKKEGVMETKPDGAEVRKDGTIVRPDGVVIYPDGTMIKLDADATGETGDAMMQNN